MNIPFLMVSSHSNDRDFIKLCEAHHASAVMAKPITAAMLQDVIQKNVAI